MSLKTQKMLFTKKEAHIKQTALANTDNNKNENTQDKIA